MGKLSSFFRGRWRVGWLALIVGVAAAILIVDAALAKSRKRGDDNPWDNSPGRYGFAFSRDNGSRGNFDGGGRGNSDGRGAANTSAASRRDADRDSNDKADKANDKADKANDKNDKADRKGKDDDDDDGRSAPQRDAGKSQNKGSGRSKGADGAEPPKTVVEMLQRMFPANSGPSNDNKSSNRSDDDRPAAGKPGDANKGANTTTAAKKEAPPTPTRAGAAEGP